MSTCPPGIILEIVFSFHRCSIRDRTMGFKHHPGLHFGRQLELWIHVRACEGIGMGDGIHRQLTIGLKNFALKFATKD